jgi:hypothetical protein
MISRGAAAESKMGAALPHWSNLPGFWPEGAHFEYFHSNANP